MYVCAFDLATTVFVCRPLPLLVLSSAEQSLAWAETINQGAQALVVFLFQAPSKFSAGGFSALFHGRAILLHGTYTYIYISINMNTYISFIIGYSIYAYDNMHICTYLICVYT